MYRRLMYSTSDQDFRDHELLEMLLYMPLKRVNTNDIAHRLIDRFGSLAKVLEASRTELETVKGVGEKTAKYIGLVNKIVKKMDCFVYDGSLPSSEKADALDVDKVIDYHADLCRKCLEAVKDTDEDTIVAATVNTLTYDFDVFFADRELPVRSIVADAASKKCDRVVVCTGYSEKMHTRVSELLRCLEFIGINAEYCFAKCDEGTVYDFSYGIRLSEEAFFESIRNMKKYSCICDRTEISIEP